MILEWDEKNSLLYNAAETEGNMVFLKNQKLSFQ